MIDLQCQIRGKRALSTLNSRTSSLRQKPLEPSQAEKKQRKVVKHQGSVDVPRMPALWFIIITAYNICYRFMPVRYMSSFLGNPNMHNSQTSLSKLVSRYQLSSILSKARIFLLAKQSGLYTTYLL